MAEESKQVDPKINNEVVKEVVESKNAPEQDASDDDPANRAAGNSDAVAAEASSKKKKSKKKKLKSILTGSKDNKENTAEAGPSSSSEPPKLNIKGNMVEQLLQANPSLKPEVAGLSKSQAEDMLSKLKLEDLLTGMSIGGKNQKDMASYKFWSTQPVARFDDKPDVEEGPIKIIDPEKVPSDPAPLIEGFEWVTMDLNDEKELEEVYDLLTYHYVEDDEAMFRFNYSASFFGWALKSPGWTKDWHVGVRATQSRKLVAFISGVPVDIRVRDKVVKCSEINFLCIHKKLRSKRLAPVLIKEITRRCYRVGVQQAVYTGGVVLPKPVSSCRYFHRSLDWLKLYEVGFSPMPAKSTKARQITKYHLPGSTSTNGLRQMQEKDVDAVCDLLNRYLKRFEFAPNFTKEEVYHWLLHKEGTTPEQVVWSYVVEEPGTGKIIDFFSFYLLESSVIGNKKHDCVRAAYLFYYATETAFQPNALESGALKVRLNALMHDALILAKRYNFDVFNALTLLDNPLFLQDQKFGAGDGQLHYYLYNYRVAPISGGVDQNNDPDPTKMGGVGLVML
ncbi:Glycylpeptide N-tetradecanoyltransferase [Xylona heveae TC161]|uniref:Glycylpeptide N-tetradecanoyltransferase n=1 Tax=Xylona heveae (strain CBS 132557 / TC161) TaxID=1328760 RepID=A0A165JGZ2_XYLHT|nr:Glycylpeptide N-tetradecanoyltransferase [Xylona heveae TC161]KZF26226.1 Glycylpeptide N-tetradecanoyltransferase [Xylona heveae TC161]